MAAAGVANHLSLLASSPLSMACPGLTFCLPPPPPAPAPWLAREQVVGRNCRFLQGPGTDRAEVARLRAALQADPAQPVTVRLLNYRQDGSTFWNCLHVSPVYVHGLHALTHTHTHMSGHLEIAHGLAHAHTRACPIASLVVSTHGFTHGSGLMVFTHGFTHGSGLKVLTHAWHAFTISHPALPVLAFAHTCTCVRACTLLACYCLPPCYCRSLPP